jgi:hypothetical protein
VFGLNFGGGSSSSGGGGVADMCTESCNCDDPHSIMVSSKTSHQNASTLHCPLLPHHLNRRIQGTQTGDDDDDDGCHYHAFPCCHACAASVLGIHYLLAVVWLIVTHIENTREHIRGIHKT